MWLESGKGISRKAIPAKLLNRYLFQKPPKSTPTFSLSKKKIKLNPHSILNFKKLTDFSLSLDKINLSSQKSGLQIRFSSFLRKKNEIIVSNIKFSLPSILEDQKQILTQLENFSHTNPRWRKKKKENKIIYMRKIQLKSYLRERKKGKKKSWEKWRKKNSGKLTPFGFGKSSLWKPMYVK